MKKIIAIISALALITCVAVIFTACGTDDMNETTKENIITTDGTVTSEMKNDGVVTDESEKGDNGAIGEAITKTSEGLSNAVTMASEKISEAFD